MHLLPEERPARAVCYRCLKPRVTCVCMQVPFVHNRTSVLVLQHPRERFHPIGTARFVELGLARSRVEVAWSVQSDAAPAGLPDDAAVLYPSADATELVEGPGAPAHLIVLDGTWHNAHTLHRDQRWLHSLRHYRLPTAAPSRYRIRREPRRECLSTIEAVVRALAILEPETRGLDQLLVAFDAMIDAQIDARARREGTPRVRGRRRAQWRALPRALLEDYPRLVIAYGESSLMRHEEDPGREIVQWTALRPATGRTFEALSRPRASLLRPWHLDHMGLCDRDFPDAGSEIDLHDAWQRFVRPGDVVAAWNAGTLELASRHLGRLASRIVLKSVYGRLRPAAGSLDEIVKREGLEPDPLPFRGRAATRMGNVATLVRHLRQRALGDDTVDGPPTSAPASHHHARS